MTPSCISLSHDGAISRLSLNRAAKGNSLSRDMVQELDAAIDTCSANGSQALLVEGAGPHFCTGFDLSDLEQESDDSLLGRFVRVELMLQKIHRAPFLTAALAHGKTWGAGADLFAACTLRWAGMDATFAFPGAGFGLVLGSGRLAALVGPAMATDWIGSGRRIGATEAQQHGLVQTLGDDLDGDQVVNHLRTMAGRLDPVTLAQVRAATLARSACDDAADLARLVRSAARAGLKDRIAAYRTALRRDK